MFSVSQKKSGFTLVEIIVSVTIFAIMMSIAVASFLNLSVTLKKQNIQRKLYSEISRIVEDTDRLGKFFTIDYEAYGETLDVAGGSGKLILLSKDGQHRITMEVPEGETSLMTYKEKKEAAQFVPETGFEDGRPQALTSEGLLMEHARFFIFPAQAESAAGEPSFQPKVTLVLKGQMVNPFKAGEDQYEQFNLQTTFSIRPY